MATGRMIKVLQDWEEVGRSLGALQQFKCGYHGDPIKNWDLALIASLMREFPKGSRILDMGCSGSPLLRFCSKAGYRIIGVDFFRTLFIERARQCFDFLKNGFKVPYSIRAKDLTRTGFKSGSFDMLVCLSVIEHGVPLDAFFRESSRLLKTGGKLYVSTDYWPTGVERTDSLTRYGLSWKVFTQPEIKDLITLARSHGLVLKNEKIPPAKEKVCLWRGKQYTFIALIFQKK